MLKIDYGKSIIDGDGAATIVGSFNDKSFCYNIHYALGFTHDTNNNLTLQEKNLICEEFENSRMFAETVL